MYLDKRVRSMKLAEFKNLMLNLLDKLKGMENQPFTTNAPPCVGIFWHHCGEGRILLQLLHLSGYNGSTMEKPLPIRDIQMEVKGQRVKKATALTPEGKRSVEPREKTLYTPVLEQYAAYLLEL